MEVVTWRNISGYLFLYKVSRLGEVKSLERKDSIGRKLKERIMKPQLNKYGYFQISLFQNNKPKSFAIHVLVYNTFKGKVPNGFEIDHIDNNKLNNDIDNLQLLKSRKNVSKAYLEKKTTSEYTGVHWSRSNNKWQAQIRIDGKKKSLGFFDIEEDARDAYNNKLKTLWK